MLLDTAKKQKKVKYKKKLNTKVKLNILTRAFLVVCTGKDLYFEEILFD
jgi:hypothetical protein